MRKIAHLILLTTILSSLSQALPTLPLIETNNLKLYRTTSNIRLDQQFAITFRNDYSNPPVFVYGISQYYLGALHLYENVSNFLFSLSGKQARINVTSFGGSNFQWLAIAYFAVQQSCGFLSDSVEDGYISSEVSGNHYNQTNVTKANLVFQADNYTCLVLLRGFLWNYSKIAKDFGLSISVKVNSNMSYTYRIDAPARFTAREVAFDLLFFNQQSISRLQVLSASTLVYSIAATDYRRKTSFQRVVVECNETTLIVGLKGFFSDNYLANRELGWNSSCVSNSANNTGVLTIATANWKKLEFSFLHLRLVIEQDGTNGSNNTNGSGNPKKDPEPTTNNQLPIYVLALGAIGGIMLLVIVGVIIKRSCKRLRESRELVPQQNFRSFPTISL